MRVIAGKARRLLLKAPEGMDTRPTADRVKESLFNMLNPDLYECCFLDLFSGSGAIGIEALSRGASLCVFGDSSRESIRLIKANIAHCRAEERAVVVPGDYRRTLTSTSETFDIILLDPPYDKGLLEPCFELIRERGLLNEGGVIIAEHRKEEVMEDEICGFSKVKERRYGIVMLSIYC